MMRRRISGYARALLAIAASFIILAFSSLNSPGSGPDENGRKDPEFLVHDNARRMINEGRHTFRFDTFGDEAFWGGDLKLHQAIAGAKLGGIGPGVSPEAALGIGLKVDVDALPRSVRVALAQGKVDLKDPATTLALLKMNAVLGVTGFLDTSGRLESVGIQCALCHSTVDNSFAQGIGHRLDGWANRDLNVGAIIALAPDLSVPANVLGVDQSTVRKVLNSWGPESSMLNSSWMERRFGPTGHPRRCSFLLLSVLLA
jgi:hypothetical protein